VRSLHRGIRLGFGPALALLLLGGFVARRADAAMTGLDFDTPLLVERPTLIFAEPTLAAPVEGLLPTGSQIDELGPHMNSADGMLWLQVGRTDLRPLGWVPAASLLPAVGYEGAAAMAAPEAPSPQSFVPPETVEVEGGARPPQTAQLEGAVPGAAIQGLPAPQGFVPARTVQTEGPIQE
jgi:hypothetical protein